jgi:molecular chaperone GrpE
MTDDEPQRHEPDALASLEGDGVSESDVDGDVGDVIAEAEAAAHAAAALEARAEADPRSRAELIAEVDAVEAQRDEYLDDLRRAHADFENYRKRVARDGIVQREHGRADVVTALLDVLDDLDRTVVADSVAGTPAAAAVGVVIDKAGRALGAVGVERIDVAGVPFDPTVHDAVQQVEDADAEEPTVREVLRAGYRIGERVLRAAMVVVAQR